MATGHWECLYCESVSKPRKVKGELVCRNCNAPWEEAIWVEDVEDESENEE